MHQVDKLRRHLRRGYVHGWFVDDGTAGGKARWGDDAAGYTNNLNCVSITHQMTPDAVVTAQVFPGERSIYDGNILAGGYIALREKASRFKRYLQGLEIGRGDINQIGHLQFARL